MSTSAESPGSRTRRTSAFYDVYGDWDPLTPAELADLMAGFPEALVDRRRHAMEAFTGVRRFHEDIDLVVFPDAVPALRTQLGGSFHLWCNHGGTFRILDDEHPEPLDPLCQIWMRENAKSPWRVDCILNPWRDRQLVSRHDDTLDAPLDDVTWVAADGIRYLNPRSRCSSRPGSSDARTGSTSPTPGRLLSTEQRFWLRDAVHRTYGPDHSWAERLAEH